MTDQANIKVASFDPGFVHTFIICIGVPILVISWGSSVRRKNSELVAAFSSNNKKVVVVVVVVYVEGTQNTFICMYNHGVVNHKK